MGSVTTYAEFQHRQAERELQNNRRIAEKIIKSEKKLAIETWLEAGNGRNQDQYHPEEK